MDELIALHTEEYGREPEIVVSAPGSVNVIGEHNDADDGLVLEAAIDRYLSVGISRRQDSSLRFYSSDLHERKRTTIQNLKYRREDRWANYPKGVIYELMQLGYDLDGFDLSVSSEIPHGIGLGSSAAFGVATALALSELFDLDLSEFQIVQSAAMAEVAFLGIETSITDHLVSAVSQEQSAVYLDLRSFKYEHVPVELGGVKLLLTVSNVPNVSYRNELYARREKCRSWFAEMKDDSTGRSFRDISASEFRLISESTPEDVRRLCTHIINENELVEEAKLQLKQGDVEALGKTLNHSHESLRDNYEVSCPEIDWLIKRAGEVEGIYGSRLTGPGFGGCTLSLIREESIPAYRETIEDYERIFGFKPETFVFEPADGVRRAPTLVKP